MDIDEKTSTFEGPDGLRIFYRSCQAEEELAQFVIAHGIGEHSGRYGNIANKLVPDGISVWAMNLWGHRKSNGRRGHISAFADYITDLESMLQDSIRP